MIVNAKLEGRNNYLHFLINCLSEDNQATVSEMLRVMLANFCNPNSPNEQMETPFHLLLKKLRRVYYRNDLVKLFIDNSTVDIYAHDDIIALMKTNRVAIRKVDVVAKDQKKGATFMTQLLDQFYEARFISEFESFEKVTTDYHNDIALLLEAAILRDLHKTVNFLITRNVNVNGVSRESKFKLAPAFLACFLGHHKVLKLLVSDAKLKFESDEANYNLLHQILLSENVELQDREKCFDIIIGDRRCSLEVINALNDKRQSALSIACTEGFNEIAKELLRRNAYIGHEGIVDNIDKEVLEEYLNECVKTPEGIVYKNSEVHIDYRFLVPPNVHLKSHLEVRPIFMIASKDKLEELILHPVFATFIDIQWKKIRAIIYFNLLVYFLFLILFASFVFVAYDSNIRHIGSRNESDVDFNSTQSHSNIYSEEYIKWLLAWHKFCVVGVALIAIYESIQCLLSFKNYFFKLSNYIDVFFILFSIKVLGEYYDEDDETFELFKKVRAITILIVAAQSIQLITRVSFMSISLHIAIFMRVCATFLKTTSLYLIMILAFALSFYTLNYEESNEGEGEQNSEDDDELSFSDVFSSIIITIRMMLSDFEHIKFKKGDQFYGILFLLFVILISIVLFNLLNALAISDTYEILKDAELVDTKKRVSIMNSYEKLHSILKFSFANIFPGITSIVLTPNKDNFIKRSIKSNNDIIVSIQKIGKPEKIQIIYATKFFCKKTPMKLSNEIMEKVMTFVKSKE